MAGTISVPFARNECGSLRLHQRNVESWQASCHIAQRAISSPTTGW
jgi:hypothetical protein